MPPSLQQHFISTRIAFSIFAAFWLMVLSGCGSNTSDTYQAGSIIVAKPYARATVPQQANGSAYLNIENRGNKADKLLRAGTPLAAAVEIHTMSMQGDMMRMQELPALPIAAGQNLTMHPGDGPHLMLIGLKQALKEGQVFPMTLEFEQVGAVEVMVKVQAIGSVK